MTIKQLYKTIALYKRWCEKTRVKSIKLIIEQRTNCEEIIKNEVLKAFKI
jgi:hypothetical protein